MSVGLVVPLPAYTLDPAFYARKAEELGFESLWYHEHPILPVSSDSPFPATGGEIPWTYAHFTEPYIALAMAAAVTERIKLCTGITLVPERNPLILAKQISVLDLHSQGRFVFGVGAGWNREETTMMGGDFDHRWSQAREAVLALKELWDQGRGRVSRQVLRLSARLYEPQALPETPPARAAGRQCPQRAAPGGALGRRLAPQPR